MQVGDADFVQLSPSTHPVTGDPDDTSGPTYAALRGVVSLQPGENAAPARVGEVITDTLSRDGVVESDPAKAGIEAGRLVVFDDALQHNIPRVFWDFLNSQGLIYRDGSLVTAQIFDPLFVVGHPIGEAYWVKAKVAGQVVDVLMQPFERRTLTYTPSNPPGWQVEMGNIGRHYYAWRYGTDEMSQPPAQVPSFGWSTLYNNGPRDSNRIAITFDDGGPAVGAILSILREKGVHSTMFPSGRWAEANPGWIQQIVQDGHELGNHTYSHSVMQKPSSWSITWEVMRGEKAIVSAGHYPQLLFRFPYGAGGRDGRALAAVGSAGYSRTIGWDVDPKDWRGNSASYMIQNVLSHARGGSIVLFHLGGAHTAQALPTIIDTLRARGYELVTVSELLSQ